MQINYKITVNAKAPDSEIDEILKDTNRKLSEYRKFLEHEMEKIISNMFMQEELVGCKVKVSFKKDKEGDSTGN